jgi:hypothetical protein
MNREQVEFTAHKHLALVGGATLGPEQAICASSNKNRGWEFYVNFIFIKRGG